VVEAMLFVGRPENGLLTAREMAAAMRGVSPAEVDAAVAELNTVYERDGAPYHIEGSSHGYRLTLRQEFARLRDKYYGRVREARLSPAALEVLSVVAYNQPVTIAQIDELRGRPSGAVLATLVRRQLVRLERHSDHPGGASRYWTTDRFLRLFGLESAAGLPQDEEVSECQQAS
jgi:segregation and condensation protein B